MAESETELRERIDRLEAELAAAKKFDIEFAQAKRFEIGELGPSRTSALTGSLPIVIAIFVQTAGAIWWASSLSARVESMQAAAQQRDNIISTMSRTIQDNAERLTRVQTVQENVVKLLDRITQSQGLDGPARGP